MGTDPAGWWVPHEAGELGHQADERPTND